MRSANASLRMGLSTVCPYLYRDREGKFVCEALGTRVDPGLMPCLINYTSCPHYQQRALTQARPPEPAVAPSVVEAAVQPVEVKEPPPAERGVEELEEEVVRALDSVEKFALELNERWSLYEEGAKRLEKMWGDASTRCGYALKALDDVVGFYEKMVESMKKLLESGRITKEVYEELSSEARSTLEEYRRRREGLEDRLRSVERLVLPHIQRLKAAGARSEISKLRLGLMKLEQLFKEGKVSQEVYERMRRELEERIKQLSYAAGEGS